MNSILLDFAKHIRNTIRDKIFWVWKGTVYEQNTCEIRRITPRIPVKFRFGDFSDVAKLDIAHYEYDSEAKQFAMDRLQNGDKVIFGEYQGRIVYYMWIMFNAMDIDYRNYIPISSDRIYAYKRFTVKEYRGMSIAPAAYSFILDNLKLRGCEKLLGILDSRNIPSIRSTIKLGYYSIGNIYKIRLFSKMVYIISHNLRKQLLEITHPHMGYSPINRRH